LPQADLGPVKIDPSQIDQILINLYINTRDAMVGEGTITSTAENIIVEDAACVTLPEIGPGKMFC
jgi:two-component system cell cycle sensor histidine kinase/response regulator CckA